MIRVYFLKKRRLSFYAISGDIVRCSVFQAFRLWGRQKGTRGPVIIYRRGEDLGLNKVKFCQFPPLNVTSLK